MRRFLIPLSLCTLVAVWGCGDDLLAPTTGTITLQIAVADLAASRVASVTETVRGGEVTEGTPREPSIQEVAIATTSSQRAGAEARAQLDNLRVSVSGPTSKTQTFPCGATVCEGTVTGLEPGTYAVTLEGLIAGAVDQFGETSGVLVAAGQDTEATIPFASFRPVLNPFAEDTTELLRFTVSYSPVNAADSYIVEYATTPDFSGASSLAVSGTSTEITVTDEAEYFVRVRAVNEVVSGGGRPSETAAIVAFQGVATVLVTPANPTLGAGVMQQFSAEARDGDDNVVPNVNFFWSSSNPNVARVEQNGEVTTVGIGQATITAVGKGTPGSVLVTVQAGPPNSLAFIGEPDSGEPFGPFAPTVGVAVVDALGNVVTSSAVDVTVAIGTNPTGATLSGTPTVTAANGIATFSDLSIDAAGVGYTLSATASGVTDATSVSFNVTLEFVQMSTGDITAFKCGVTVTRAAYCWGRNSAGQLGYGPNPETDFPVRVSGGHQFSSVSVGGLFSNDGFACGVTTAGAALCWGLNSSGQLGDGNMPTNSDVPVPVAGGHTFSSVSAGVLHACGVRTDGAALCWGNGANGRLGNNATGNSGAPVLVSGGHAFTSVDAGGSHTCGLRVDNSVLCWGFGNPGQLGTGGVIGAIPDALVPVVVGGVYESVNTSDGTTCAIRTADRRVTCWGSNAAGQFGNGTTTGSSLPVLSTSPVQFASVSTGGQGAQANACGVTAAGDGWCWGFGAWGAIGNGLIANALVPTPVIGSRPWLMIDAGRGGTSGVTADHVGFTWGNGTNGERGDGTNILIAPTPVPVLGSGLPGTMSAGAIRFAGSAADAAMASTNGR